MGERVALILLTAVEENINSELLCVDGDSSLQDRYRGGHGRDRALIHAMAERILRLEESYK